MPRGFQSRIALSYIALLLSLCVVAAVILVTSIWSSALSVIESSLNRSADLLTREAIIHYQEDGGAGLSEFINRVNASDKVQRVTLISPEGAVLAGAAVGDSVPATALRQALADGRATARRYSAEERVDILFSVYPVLAGPHLLGYLRLGQPLTPVYDSVREGVFFILAGLVVAALAAAALSALIARTLTKRLDELSLATRRLAAGNWNVPVRTAGEDEVADLAHAIDDLRNDLRVLFVNERSRSRLEGVNLTARELAHRLNNDLAITVGNLDLIAESPDTPDGVRHRVRQALEGLDRSLDDISKFQQVVRVETKPTPSGMTLDLDRSVALAGVVSAGSWIGPDTPDSGPVIK